MSIPAQENLKNSSDNRERDRIRRRSSRLSSSISHEILNADHVTTSVDIQPLKDTASNPKDSEKGKLRPGLLWGCGSRELLVVARTVFSLAYPSGFVSAVKT